MKDYKPNELEMALRIAKKAIDQLIDQKPKGGLVVNKGTPYEAKMSYQEAKLCMERLERRFAVKGAFSFGICSTCTKWNTASHDSGKWGDFGTCTVTKQSTHRYHSCESHSITNGGWGL